MQDPAAIPAAAPNAEQARAHRLMRNATNFAVAMACSLIVVKLVAWIATGSLALLASLVDSALDAAASLINLMAVRHALQPADTDHRFGHGKAESLAGLAQSAFIGGSAIFLLLESAQRLVTPQPVSRDDIGIVVMLVSMAATLGLVLYQRHVIRETKSLAITADSSHYTGDILVNAGVIVSFVAHRFTALPWIDAATAMLIALYLAHKAWEVGMISFDQLMDKEMPEEERARICRIALAESGALAMHDLRTRISGPTSFIQLHLEVAGDMTVTEAHDIVQRVEDAIAAAFSAAEVIVHIDPIGTPDPGPLGPFPDRVFAVDVQPPEDPSEPR